MSSKRSSKSNNSRITSKNQTFTHFHRDQRARIDNRRMKKKPRRIK